MINNYNSVISLLNKNGLEISNKINIVDKKQTKNTSTSKEFIEFKEGYFSFLDKLYESIKFGKIDKNILNLINSWLPHIENNIKQREIKLYNKYRIIYSKWLEHLIES